ncbi:MAG: regulatory iron-sulfur-containing complex subunit RicT [Anaerolineales bacterium]
MMAHIVGIRFHGGGKTYHFDSSACPDTQEGDYVIVETSRGQQLGQVVSILDAAGGKKGRHWKPILRAASSRDLVLRQAWEKKEQGVLLTCREIASGEDLEDVKFVSAEFSLEGDNLVFLYCYEEKGDPDFKGLLLKLKKKYPKTNLDLRRIGPRDAAKIIGGMGACGREIRCCTEFMTEFIPISIKMAKEQGISLAPTEITGMCGRLRCCLMYEHEQYVEAKKTLPKQGKMVSTPRGEGKVIRLNPLSQKVSVDLGEAGIQDFDHDEVERIHK